jgi:hypothetical protein
LIALALITVLTLQAAPDERKEAAGHYQRAVGLYKDGDFQAALLEFRTAWELAPSFEVLFNIALCQRRLFNYALAMRTLDQYLMEGGARIAAERRDAVAREREAIRALTAPVAIIVDGKPASVSVDGEKVGQTPLQDLLVLSVGKHKLRAEREGCTPDERTVEVRSGQALSVQLAPVSLTEPVEVTIECATPKTTLRLDQISAVSCPTVLALVPGNHELLAQADGFVTSRTEVSVQPGQVRKVTVSELVPRPPPFPTAGVSLMAGGVVVGGVGLAFALMASANAERTSTLIRSGGPWDAAAISNEAAGQRNSLLGWTFLGVGGAALVAGVVALVVQVKSPTPVTVSFLPAPGGLAACASF